MGIISRADSQESSPSPSLPFSIISEIIISPDSSSSFLFVVIAKERTVWAAAEEAGEELLLK